MCTYRVPKAQVIMPITRLTDRALSIRLSAFYHPEGLVGSI